MGIPITKSGYKYLHSELSALKAEVQAATREAREAKKDVHITKSGEHGLAINTLVHKAQRIKSLKTTLENAYIIDPAKIPRDGCCRLGTYVELQEENGDKISFQIVGKLEAEILQGNFCSSSSPLGGALLGKKEGDEIFVETPDGEREYTLLAVRYEEMKEIISERVAEKAVEEIKEPEPQPAPVAVEKTAEPEETITEEIPAPVAPVEEAPAPSAPQEKATFWSAALAWVKKLFK